ncbi:hypothetical protein [Treponema phagedenis]|uniref:hypothetical protein n=1 Tax=Treponema phagedenis TaxID=162 RepID=UPI0001F63D8C|nr:hypothetical protein [Treponema phagedenis]EFW38458.1 hypothetical protein HMPREF9554_01041 [Treponema phagedenis F0421]TYT79026.1 hypothetical protein FS559_07850 [Treponema phagedenis]
MTLETKKKLIKYGYLFGIIIGMFLLLWGFSSMATFVKETVLIQAAQDVLKETPAHKHVQILSLNKTHSGYPLSGIALNAKDNDKEVKVFLLPLMGKYGSFQGVFVYDSKKGCEFSGLTGNLDQKDADYYGISKNMCKIICQKIEKTEGF